MKDNTSELDMVAQVPTVSVLDLNISMTTLPDAIDMISAWVKLSVNHRIHVCTTHTALECHDDPELARNMNAASLALPDGMPLVWLGRLRKHKVSRVYGPDLMLATCERGLSEGFSHFLYGSRPATLDRLCASLREQFPGINIVGQISPPFRELSAHEKADMVRLINTAKPDIVWIGLGTPKQDWWAIEFRERLSAPVLIPVGAAFDFHAGNLSQAPRWMMHCGLEWLYRFLCEPKRLWRRYLIGNPRFVFHVCMQHLFPHRYKSPR